MNKVVNPYQPPAKATDSKPEPLRDRIQLRGAVSLGDIESLMRVSKIRYVLRMVAVIVLAPFFCIPFILLIWDHNDWIAAILCMASALVLAGVVFTLDRLIGARHRARRLVKRHPELVGPLRGHVDDFGITYLNESANQCQQFSWSCFPEVSVSSHGIRLDWRSSDDAFMAVPASCIAGFDESRVRQEVRRLQGQCSQPAVYQVCHDWSAAPPDAIRFENLVHPKPPLTPKQLMLSRTVWAIEWLLTIMIIGLVLYEQSTATIAALIAASIAVSLLAWLFGLKSKPARFMLGQWGWLTAKGGQSHLPGVTAMFQWTDATSVQVSGSHLLAQFAGGTGFYLTPDDLIDGDWSTLTDWLSERIAEH